MIIEKIKNKIRRRIRKYDVHYSQFSNKTSFSIFGLCRIFFSYGDFSRLELVDEEVKVYKKSKYHVRLTRVANIIVYDSLIYHAHLKKLCGFFILGKKQSSFLRILFNEYHKDFRRDLRLLFLKWPKVKTHESLSEILDRNIRLKSFPLIEFSCVTLVDPKIETVELVNSINYNVNIIVLLTKNYLQNNSLACFVENNLMIDALILPSDSQTYSDKDLSQFKSIFYYNEKSSAGEQLSVVVNNLSQVRSLLIPVIGSKFHIKDLCELGTRRRTDTVDILLYLKSPIGKEQLQSQDISNLTFYNLIEMISDNLDSVLVKEFLFFRYINFLNRNDVKSFLVASLKDGHRYEVRYRNTTY